MTTSHLILAIMLVESNANIDAVGDNGTAHGCFQLTKAYIQDAAEHAKENWSVDDAYSYEKSRMIFTSYMHRYATPERLGRAVTPQDIARIHNGGPNGWKKESTEKYWKKVKDILEYAE
tara:strand:- start:271 stop:627 length:357 start_codon:yes stop_codon:yes gene_type:complete